MTRILHTRDELRTALAAAQRPVGLVPTMGWLHAGHRSLIRQSRADDATTVVTIFINPPPTSFLYLTSAMSGSTPVVSQSIMNPMVPVGARTVAWAFR